MDEAPLDAFEESLLLALAVARAHYEESPLPTLIRVVGRATLVGYALAALAAQPARLLYARWRR